MGSQADSVNRAAYLFEGGDCPVRTKVAQETHDEAAGNAQLLFGILQSFVYAVHDICKGHFPVCVGLWVKHDLHIHHRVLGSPREVSPSQVIEVLQFEKNLPG